MKPEFCQARVQEDAQLDPGVLAPDEQLVGALKVGPGDDVMNQFLN
jgi:hypothetical protein